MKQVKSKLLMISLLAASVLSGCKPSKPDVVVTTYPVSYLVQRIGGDYVNVHNISNDTMIQRATIQDDYKSILSTADVMFYINGLEPYMELYLDDFRAAKLDMVDLSTTSGIYSFKRYTSTTVDGKNTTVESPYYEGELFKGLDTYDKDPMLWMDPIAMSSMGATIKDYLIQEYPEYSKAFTQNYASVENDLARMDADFVAIKNDKISISFVSMTPSFGNWQKSYGVRVYPVCLSKYGALPTDSQLAIIKEKIRNDGVRYIVKEENLPEDMLALQQQLVNELGLISVDISNLSSLTESDKAGGYDYRSIMYENLKVLESMAE